MMARFLLYFLAFLGALFVVLVIAVSVFIYRNQALLSLVPLPGGSDTSSVLPIVKNADVNAADKHPLLNDSQEALLENVGVDPAALPQRITPAMATCFETKLGKARTDEIKAGATPSMTDFLAAQSCLSL